jgi:hypothetical protein
MEREQAGATYRFVPGRDDLRHILLLLLLFRFSRFGVVGQNRERGQASRTAEPVRSVSGCSGVVSPPPTGRLVGHIASHHNEQSIVPLLSDV